MALEAGGGSPGGPVMPKEELVGRLRSLLKETFAFGKERDVDFEAIKKAEGFQRAKFIDDAAEAFLVSDETKKAFMSRANTVKRLYKAILPDPEAAKLSPDAAPVLVVAKKIRSLAPVADIGKVMAEVETILDASIAAEGYVIEATPEEDLIDLSEVDFEALTEKFQSGRKRTQFERLKALVEGELLQMVELNRSRIDFLERFQTLIDDYNAGSANIEELWQQLVELANSLKAEGRRHMTERLTEEELAMFDILTKPAPELTEKERNEVKKVARELLESLKGEKLVLDWRKRQQSRAMVRHTIEVGLDRLPERYAREAYKAKCETVYQHVYDSYYGGGRSVYGGAAM